MKKILVLSLLSIGVLCVHLKAQEQAFYPIQSDNGSYEGEGVQWILDRADTVRFFMFGEQHGVEGIAEFVDFMYKELHKQGFNYLVLETDGWTAQRSVDLGVDEFSKKNPHSIAFDTNGDLKLMQSAIDLNPSVQTPIWGVDQMQTAIHPFHRLVEIANTSEQKRIARGSFLKAALKMGRYTRQDHQKDLEAIEKVFSDNPSKEKDRIIQEIRQTMEIFFKWMNPTTRNESVEIREALMGKNFDRYLETTQDAKAVFKMGGAHTMYGIGPNGVPTFGDHVKQVANRNNQSTLSISIYRFNPERSLINESDFGESKMLLLDSKSAALLFPQDSGKFKQVDATILLKDAGYANKSINRAYEAGFRNRLIKGLIPLALCFIICIITIIIFLIKVGRGKKTLTKYPAFASLLITGLAVFQILQILDLEAAAAISIGYFTLAIHLFLLVVTLVFVYKAVLVFKSDFSLMSKACYGFFTLCFGLLSYFIHFWNIGGMLGW